MNRRCKHRSIRKQLPHSDLPHTWPGKILHREHLQGFQREWLCGVDISPLKKRESSFRRTRRSFDFRMVFGFSPLIATPYPYALLEPCNGLCRFPRLNLGRVILDNCGEYSSNCDGVHESSLVAILSDAVLRKRRRTTLRDSQPLGARALETIQPDFSTSSHVKQNRAT